MMPQPVPQNLQTPLSHCIPASASFDLARAAAGIVMPTAVAVAAAALVFSNSLRVSSITFSWVGCLDMVLCDVFICLL
jgi:hypothetical protein